MVMRLVTSAFALALLASCSDSSFSGGGKQADSQPKKQKESKEESSDDFVEKVDDEPRDARDDADTELGNATEDDGEEPEPALEEDEMQGTGVDACLAPKGEGASTVALSGEDFPNNPYDWGGFDNDDYKLTFSGDLLMEGKAVAIAKAQSVQVAYARAGSNCNHSFLLRFRKCPAEGSTVVGEAQLVPGKGYALTQTVQVPAKVYVDIHLATSDCDYPRMGGMATTVDLFKSQGQFFSVK